MKTTVVSAAVFCLVCLCAPSAPAHALQASSIIPIPTSARYSMFLLTPTTTSSKPNPTLSFVLVNTIFNDPTEIHTVIFLTIGAGTVNLTISPPATAVDLQYAVAGFLGQTPITQLGLLGLPVTVEADVQGFGLGVFRVGLCVVYVTITNLTIPSDLPVVMSMDVSLTQTTITTTSTTTTIIGPPTSTSSTTTSI